MRSKVDTSINKNDGDKVFELGLLTLVELLGVLNLRPNGFVPIVSI